MPLVMTLQLMPQAAFATVHAVSLLCWHAVQHLPQLPIRTGHTTVTDQRHNTCIYQLPVGRRAASFNAVQAVWFATAVGT